MDLVLDILVNVLDVRSASSLCLSTKPIHLDSGMIIKIYIHSIKKWPNLLNTQPLCSNYLSSTAASLGSNTISAL